MGGSKVLIFAIISCILTASTGCKNDKAHKPNSIILTTSSYFDAAVREFDGANLTTFSLAGAGMCPGHFDLRPSQMERLRRGRILFRFDFQAGMDGKILSIGNKELKIIPIKIDGGLSEASSYVSACRQVGRELVSSKFIDARTAELKLAGIENRMKDLSRWSREEIKRAKLTGKPVLTSGHQADFCRWLGMKVVSTFSSADTIGVRTIDGVVKAGRKAGVRLIVANAAEGRQLADALAQALGEKVTVAVLDNFPKKVEGQNAFDALLKENIRTLVRGVR